MMRWVRWSASTGGGSLHSVELSSPIPEHDESHHPPNYDPPSVKQARLFRELLLPRRIVDPSHTTKHRLAYPGELEDDDGNTAQLYDFFRTPSKALDEFGIGLSLYFGSVKAFFVVFSCVAFILLVAIYENRSHQHSNDDTGGNDSGPYCIHSTNDTTVPTRINLLGSVYGTRSEDLKITKQGAADLAITLFLIIVAIFFHYLQKEEIERIDVAQQTTQDYAVVITNPPPNVLDPQEYYNHFSRFGDIAFITISVQNGSLMNMFVQRKMLLNNFHGIEVEQNTDEFLPNFFTMLRRIGILPNKKNLAKKILELETRILDVMKKKYQPWQVFITFNTEASQRDCLNKLAIGSIAETVESHDENSNVSTLLGKRLVVREAPEPSDICYTHNDRSKLEKFSSILSSYILCGGLLVGAYWVATVAYYLSPILGTIFITGVNAGLPITIKIITIRLEMHSRESEYQISILTKLLVARCVNSALFLFIRTSRADMFSEANLLSIQYILIADAFVTPFIRYLNVWDIFVRYSAVKLYHTQSELNAKWQGAQWTLAERYSDCLKTVYTGLFYAVPLPSGLFLVAMAMMTTYCCDKYSLFRLWRRKAAIDASLGNISKNFFVFSILSHVSTSYYFFTYWPFCNHIVKTTVTDEQKTIKLIYRITLIVIFISFCLGVCYKIYRKVFKFFVGYSKEVGDASETQWRDVKAAEIFLPNITHLALASPILVSDIDLLPAAYSPTMKRRGWEEVINPRGTPVMEEFQKLEKFTTAEIANAFGRVQYFESPEEELPLYCDVADCTVIIEEDELPDYAEIEPNQQLSSTITVKDFKSSRVEKSFSDDIEVRRCDDNRIFYYDPHTSEVLKRHPSRTKSNGKNKDGESSSRQLQSTNTHSSKKFSFKIGPSSTSFCLHGNMSQRFTSKLSLADRELPAGWELALTPEGEPYYVNHILKKTTWDLPEEPEVEDNS